MGWNLLTFLFLLVGAARACEPPEGLRIRYCTDNALALQSAQSCQRKIQKEWIEARKVIVPGGAGGQKGEFASAGQAYTEAMERLDRLVRRTEEAANRLAAYPKMMVDGPGVESWEESLPCYTAPFFAIEAIVQDLDRKALEGKEALASSRALKTAGAAREIALSASAGEAALPTGNRKAGASLPVIRAVKGLRSSDISGTEQRGKKGMSP